MDVFSGAKRIVQTLLYKHYGTRHNCALDVMEVQRQ